MTNPTDQIKARLAQIEDANKTQVLAVNHSLIESVEVSANIFITQLTQSLGVAVEVINSIPEFDRARGYPTGHEWIAIKNHFDVSLSKIAKIMNGSET